MFSAFEHKLSASCHSNGPRCKTRKGGEHWHWQINKIPLQRAKHRNCSPTQSQRGENSFSSLLTFAAILKRLITQRARIVFLNSTQLDYTQKSSLNVNFSFELSSRGLFWSRNRLGQSPWNFLHRFIFCFVLFSRRFQKFQKQISSRI